VRARVAGALPNVTKEAWSLVCPSWTPRTSWSPTTRPPSRTRPQRRGAPRRHSYPPTRHALENIRARLTCSRSRLLPEQVRDHLYTPTRELMADGGPDAVNAWLKGLARQAGAAAMPTEAVEAVRAQDPPLLRRSAPSPLSTPARVCRSATPDRGVGGKADPPPRGDVLQPGRTNLLTDLTRPRGQRGRPAATTSPS